ncbi:hypothetical protein AB0941_36950 [Streptomyces sp. NPDC013433]|uniref:hypothetical protein n=1 Tax=Streptomyces sp. NPDC013433 TaxID=3155604 RepID=UPI003454AAA2
MVAAVPKCFRTVLPARVVWAPGEVSTGPEDIAGEVLCIGGVLEQRGVGRRGRYVSVLVQQLSLLGSVEFVLHRFERAD